MLAHEVGRNLFFAGYNLQVLKGTRVGGDILDAGYQLLVNGEVRRNVNASVAALIITGHVEDNIAVQVSAPNSGVVYQQGEAYKGASTRAALIRRLLARLQEMITFLILEALAT